MSDTRKRILSYLFNPISIFGFILAVLGAVLTISFIAMEMFTGIENPYIGILVYFAFPGLLVFGLLVVPFGAWLVRNRLRNKGITEIQKLPILDLNNPLKLKLSIFFVVATIIFSVIVGLATLKGFEFTESTTFCGELCHVVMAPEHTAWSNSPHAKVKCVECHVGPGAQWYVKAKISGLRQVYGVLAKAYPTPIETPIDNLRPARDTCEHCHWTEKFYSGRQKIFYHYAPNEENSPREIDMLIHIGSQAKGAHTKGIHWHVGKEVTFVANDRKRNDIPYVAVKEADGSLTEYVSTEKPLSKEEIAKATKRHMDCTDCHNRPTHIYHSPGEEMDKAFVTGKIDRSIPFIKKVAVDILEKPYKTAKEANTAITTGIPAFYAKEYPKLAQEKAAGINQAVEQVKGIYSRNFFPEMKVTWATYPSNLGHFYTPGCFRCHDDKHKGPNGKVISKDCKICHTILSQTQENIPAGTKPKEFVHPVDIGDE
ncbi:MAG: NapC/NirT family cytochrome c, partial [Geobacteraceae bacterium]|nr:NapC/NirT family cytochrome c [Geobacteraceae bacterium]